MEFTSEDAAVMYARAYRAWYGRRAPRIVKDKIEELRRAGDDSGVIAWSQVARQLEQLQAVAKPEHAKAGGRTAKIQSRSESAAHSSDRE